MIPVKFKCTKIAEYSAIRISSNTAVDFLRQPALVEVFNDDLPDVVSMWFYTSPYIYRKKQLNSQSFDVPVVSDNMTIVITPVREMDINAIVAEVIPSYPNPDQGSVYGSRHRYRRQ